jgi:hypothetical protein
MLPGCVRLDRLLDIRRQALLRMALPEIAQDRQSFRSLPESRERSGEIAARWPATYGEAVEHPRGKRNPLGPDIPGAREVANETAAAGIEETSARILLCHSVGDSG